MADGVLFDVDGTLLDSVDLHARAWQQALEKFGHRTTFEEVRAQIGKGGDQLLPVFLSGDRLAVVGDAVEAYRGELYRREYLRRVRPFPGVRPLFQELLRRGRKIALASSANSDELQVYKQVLEIEDLIQGETTKTDVKKSKPHPDIFQAARAQIRDARDVLVVGDSPWDALAAHRMGLRTVGLLCGGFAEAELRAAGCVAIFRDPEDLHRRLDESPLA